MQKKFNIEVDCANCAAKIETALNKMAGSQPRQRQLYDPEDWCWTRTTTASPLF